MGSSADHTREARCAGCDGLLWSEQGGDATQHGGLEDFVERSTQSPSSVVYLLPVSRARKLQRRHDCQAPVMPRVVPGLTPAAPPPKGG